MAKANSVVVFNPWEVVAAATMSAGAAGVRENIESSFINLLQIELVPLTGNALTANTEIIVEYSGDDTNWTTGPEMSILLNDNAATDLDGNATAAATTIALTSSSNIGEEGNLWFIQDGTIADSEVVRSLSASGNDVTIVDGLINTHLSESAVYQNVKQWSIVVPASVKHVRVLCNNLDTTYSVAFTARILKTTSLT